MIIDLVSMADPVQSDVVSAYFRKLEIEISGFGSWRRNESRRISNFIVSEYELSFLEKGALKIVANGKEYLCTDGALFLFEPFVPYSVEKVCEENMDLYNLFFDFSAGFVGTELTSYILPPDRPCWYKEELPEITPLFRDIFSISQASPQGKQFMVSSLLNLCFTYMFQARLKWGPLKDWGKDPEKGKDHTESTSKHAVVKEAMLYVQKHISTPIKLYDLCHQIGVSETYLYKCFTQVLHASPKQYILQYKIRRAVQLLRFHNSSIGEAASALGFSSAYHLSNAFKKELGVSPTQYLVDTDVTLI